MPRVGDLIAEETGPVDWGCFRTPPPALEKKKKKTVKKEAAYNKMGGASDAVVPMVQEDTKPMDEQTEGGVEDDMWARIRDKSKKGKKEAVFGPPLDFEGFGFGDAWGVPESRSKKDRKKADVVALDPVPDFGDEQTMDKWGDDMRGAFTSKSKKDKKKADVVALDPAPDFGDEQTMDKWGNDMRGAFTSKSKKGKTKAYGSSWDPPLDEEAEQTGDKVKVPRDKVWPGFQSKSKKGKTKAHGFALDPPLDVEAGQTGDKVEVPGDDIWSGFQSKSTKDKNVSDPFSFELGFGGEHLSQRSKRDKSSLDDALECEAGGAFGDAAYEPQSVLPSPPPPEVVNELACALPTLKKTKHLDKKRKQTKKNSPPPAFEEVMDRTPTPDAAPSPPKGVYTDKYEYGDLENCETKPRAVAETLDMHTWGEEQERVMLEDPVPSPPLQLVAAEQDSSPGPSPSHLTPSPPSSKSVPKKESPANRPAALYSTPPHPTNSVDKYRNARLGFVEPAAPPHMPQRHFYGLPDLGLGLGSKPDVHGTKRAGSDRYCCRFDSFADSGHGPSSRKAKDALLIGSEGGLDVLRVLPNKFEVVGRLEGLPGSVLGAKILPHVGSQNGVSLPRPLVAVLLRGNEDEITATRVKVFSLLDQRHIATLYETVGYSEPTQTWKKSTNSVAGSTEGIQIYAEGKWVLVASAHSGEVFVFSQVATAINPKMQFRCLGKFWTTVQASPNDTTARPSGSNEGHDGGGDGDFRPGAPLLSLGHRWLVLVPPATALHTSIRGSPTLSEAHPNPPGLTTHVAPAPPPITCDIVGVDPEGTLTRLTRQTTRGLVKYSQKGFELGRQGWKELTHPTPQSEQSHARGGSQDQFPPTNAPAEDAKRVYSEPAIVSIIDLDALLEAEGLQPKHLPPSFTALAAFALVDGCNYLSISSTGRRLLTVSRDGKISTVWDLTRACHGVSRPRTIGGEEAALGPCANLLYRHDRHSEAVVIDSAWSRDDDMLALLTTHGTVHLHDVPLHPPSKKRKRKSTISGTPAPDKAEPTVSLSSGTSPPSSNGFIGSIRAGWQQMSTGVNTIRTQTSGLPTSFAGFKEVTASAGHAGGRALAKGLSQGYTVAKGGVGDYWHAEANKIRHLELREVGPAAGSLRWIRRESGSSLAIVCGGVVHLHPVQRYNRMKGDEVVTGLKHEKSGKKKFELPRIQTSSTLPDKRCSSEGVHGFWGLIEHPSASPPSGGVRVHPAPQEQTHEVDTNPFYCPFHVDSRVSIFAFIDAFPGSQVHLRDAPDDPFYQQGQGVPDEEPWLFGDPLPTSVKMSSVLDSTHEFPSRRASIVREPTDLLTADPHNGPSAGGDAFATDLPAGDSDDLADQMVSRLTIHPAPEREGGGDEIRIETRWSSKERKRAAREAGGKRAVRDRRAESRKLPALD